MTPSDLAHRAGQLSGGPSAEPPGRARDLSDEVVDLARSLPGDLRRLTVRDGDRAIEVEWAPDLPTADTGSTPSRRAAAAEAEEQAPDVPVGGTPVRAPLVGTFYAGPSPEADPFVRVGDEVEAGQTLGIVEAMKLMNPIVAEESGTVHEIRVADAESVEYDQVLMVLRPPGRP
ncbi:acetyl-CoA carboxylase biotin carboxyl carrier protein [Blastococcus sp. VKM Ac-2987]|uniref:acetyl-CoA carboxylase biotin carboxyl carrier protein n=1 Tax=Blastococcus sp. VKM Ac-2987 TaxID=3004141 RepID=UPI0022ABB8D9|nr:acetyl-CoA carboxylase biotin carboxyl carrier protein subunit [Blastococcus sp. VKM Ac-2987]MCZ2858692.1 acetyl-CoA carboxylase biotin carboxyl carrier protein subunit [Blastococcus sp. VKM Ac-2987]